MPFLKKDLYAFLVLVVLSITTHLLFFGYPREVVFDEVYYGNFAKSYITGQYYFDVHPPLGKLTMAFAGYAFNLFSPESELKNIGDTLEAPFVYLRGVSVFLGILLPLIIFALVRLCGFSTLTAFVAGLLITFENSLLSQSRFMLIDGQLITFGLLALFFYALAEWWRKNKKSSRGYWLWFVCAAFFAACAVSVKWTGLSFAGIIGVVEIAKAVSARRLFKREMWTRIITLSVVVFVAYSFFIALHLAFLTQSNKYSLFMSPQFQKTLKGNVYTMSPGIVPMNFVDKMIELNMVFFKSQINLMDQHSYSSEWYTWPLMKRPIYYWVGEHDTMIYLFGNPILYWLSSLSIAILSIFLVLEYLRRRGIILIAKFFQDERIKMGSIIVFGYAINFLPFVFIHRPMFLYHYLVALVFALFALVFLIDILPSKFKNISYGVLVVCAVVSFVYFSPLTYGFQLVSNTVFERFWFTSWR